MSKQLILLVGMAVPALILPHSVLAQSAEPSKLRGSISVGTNYYGPGTFHSAGTGTISSLRSFNSALPDVPAELTIVEKKFSDVYDAPMEYSLEVSYGMNDNTEMYGSIAYSTTDSAYLQVGSTFVRDLNATMPTFAEFSAVKELRLDIGGRYFFGHGSIKPFVGGSIGIMRQDEVKASFTVQSTIPGGIAIRDIPFFKQTTSVTAGVEAGISADIGERLAARLSVGARYIPSFRGEDRGLNALGLGSINNGSERLVYPVKASLASYF